MSLKNSGLKNFQKKIDTMAKVAKELDGKSEVKIVNLFTNTFITKHTNSTDLEDFFSKSGFKINSKEDFESIPDEEWSTFISKNSNFNNWEEMLQSATMEYAKHKLGF